MEIQMAYSLFKRDPNGNLIHAKYETPDAEEIRERRARIIKTRPPSRGPSDTMLEVSKLERMLNYISADCDYVTYRAIIWAIESLNWICGYELAYNWSITAPHRFDKYVLDRLIQDYKPGHFGYGTLVMYATKAGWNEAKWRADVAEHERKHEWRKLMTNAELAHRWKAGLTKDQIDLYEEQLRLKYERIIADRASAVPSSTPANENWGKLISANFLKTLPQQAYLVKGVLPATGLSACFGSSGSGKTFLVTDLGIAVALGRSWYGRKVNSCPVTFIVLEGFSGLGKRLQAWERHFKEAIPDTVKVYTDPFSLLATNHVTDLISQLNAEGQRSGLIIIDTLNQASPGADENSSKDMGLIIQNAQRLARETNSHVLLVHHTGKDASKGLRGHSSLIAALDVAIEVKRDSTGRRWGISKSKDDTDEAQYHFELKRIDLGVDSDGDQISSCVIDGAIQRVFASKLKKPQGAHQKIALDVFTALSATRVTEGSSAQMNIDDLVKAVGSNLVVDDKRRTERARAAVNSLIASGFLTLREGQITKA